MDANRAPYFLRSPLYRALMTSSFIRATFYSGFYGFTNPGGLRMGSHHRAAAVESLA